MCLAAGTQIPDFVRREGASELETTPAFEQLCLDPVLFVGRTWPRKVSSRAAIEQDDIILISDG